MAYDQNVQYLSLAFWQIIMTAGPILAIALGIGLLIGLIQAATSIQEMTLSFVPKLFVVLCHVTSDLRKYSEFNTYIIKGLPPNPICNPGEDALKAAANPANSKFYYYVSNGIGGHFFSKNLAEHNKNVKLYKSLVGKNN